MKILVDMNLSPLWVGFLGDRGIEAVHWSTVGDVTASDSDILEWAEQHDFVLFTNDLDFGMLLAARGSRKPSVLQTRTQDLLPEATGNVVLRGIEVALAHLEEGALVSIDEAGARVRVLPIQIRVRGSA